MQPTLKPLSVPYFFTLCLCALVPLCLLTGGCNMTSAERIAALQEGLKIYQEQSELLAADLADLKQIITETQQALEDPELSSELTAQMQQILDQALAAMEQVVAKKQDIDTRIAAWSAKIDQIIAEGADVGQELAVYGEGFKETASGLPPPFNTIAYIAGTLLITAGGIYAKRKVSSLAQDSRALGEVVKANEMFKQRQSQMGRSDIIDEFKQAHNARQSDRTAEIIAQKRIPLKPRPSLVEIPAPHTAGAPAA